MLRQVALRLPDVPLLVIVLPRPGWQPPAESAIDLDLVVRPLTEAGRQALLAARLPGLRPDSPVSRLALARGQGNPAAILDQLAAAVDAGLLRPSWGSWLMDDETRLDRLALGRDQLKQHHGMWVAAAAYGSAFRPDDLAEICGAEPDQVRLALNEAVIRRLVEPTTEGGYRFRQEQVGDVLLSRIDVDQRARLHQRIAEVLDQRYLSSSGPADPLMIYAIAQHYLRGTPGRAADRAFTLCRSAGRQALAAQAPGQAARLLAQAATLQPGDAELLHNLGLALLRDGDRQRAAETLAEALTGRPGRLRRAQILLTLAEVHRASGNLVEAIRTLDAGLAAVGTGWGFGATRGRKREGRRVRAALRLAGAELAASQLRRGALLTHRLAAARAAARLGPSPENTVSHAGIGLTAAIFGLRRIARQQLDRAERAATELGDPQLVATVAWHAGAADYLAEADDGERWTRCLIEHGDWLDQAHTAELLSAICWDAVLRGRGDDVHPWYHLGQPRGGDPLAPLRLATTGRTDRAPAKVSRLRAALGSQGSREAHDST